jgi:uncharacterized membrane protein
MADDKAFQEQEAPATLSQEVYRLYHGTIPHPDTLKKFGDADPSFPERIMRMSEANNAASIKTQNRASLGGLMGQVFSFLPGMSGIAALGNFRKK